MISLNNMPAGKNGIIKYIDGGYGLIQKLDTLGIRTGKKIEKISKQWMRGPVIIRSGNSELAIGYGIAQKIMVEMN